jgi:hypothetical protein
MTSERIPSRDQSQPEERSREQELGRLLSAGKFKQAVELAKERHKQLNTAESQRLLVRAYVDRIREFQKKGMSQEAQTLLTLVQQRFPSERHQLAALEVRAAATTGRFHDLLRPLISTQTSPQIRSAIEGAIASHVIDLPALAACDALPKDHPLRVGAAATWNAFLAVTSRPVSEAEISLPEVSRRSPLSAWKLLIRGSAAFYRDDDAACLRALDAIPADSAVAHVGAALRAMVEGKKPASGVAAALFKRVLGDQAALRVALDRLDAALDSSDLYHLQGCIREALRTCSQWRPQLAARLRQHISVACLLHDVPTDLVVETVGSATRDAYFWRLVARAAENDDGELAAAMYWERFLRHGVHEKLFGPASAEAAAIWLHIASVLSRFSLEESKEHVAQFLQFGEISAYYNDQPAEIAALRPESNERLARDVLEPGSPFKQAAIIRPDAETFQRWWAWAESVDLPDKQKEQIAMRWHQSRPTDAQPLLILTSLAEERDALSLALKRLGEAEAIDPLNAAVRQARVRLTMSVAWRHFADCKPHLVEKDLVELARLPGMLEGDRATVLEAMRGAWHALRGDEGARSASARLVSERIGAIAGPPLFATTNMMARLPDPSAAPGISVITDAPALELAIAWARLLRVASELDLSLWSPKAWIPKIQQVLHQRPTPLSDSDLLFLGRGGLAISPMDFAYSVSAAGLAKTTPPSTTARFLLLRARCLDKAWHQPRRTQCLRAAIQMARQAHDEALTQEVLAAIERDAFTRRLLARARNGRNMEADVLQQVLEGERNAANFPRTEVDADKYVVEQASPDLGAAFGRNVMNPGWEEEDEQDDDEQDDEAEPTLFDSVSRDSSDSMDSIPNPKELLESAAASMGMKLTLQEMKDMMDELIGAFSGRSKKRAKRRR